MTSCRLCKPLVSGWLLVRGSAADALLLVCLWSLALAGAGSVVFRLHPLPTWYKVLLYTVPVQTLRRRSDSRPSTQRVVVIDAPPADAAAAAAPRPVRTLDIPDRRGPALDGAPEYVVRGELLRSSTSEPDAIDRRGKSKRLRDAEPARC